MDMLKFKFIILMILSTMLCKAQTTKCAFYLPDKYIGKVLQFEVEQILQKNKLNYWTIKSTYKKSGDNSFNLSVVLSKAQAFSENLDCSDCLTIQLLIKQENEALSVASIDVKNQNDISQETITTIKQAILNKRFDFSSLIVQDNRYKYIDVKSKVQVLDNGVAFVSNDLDKYITPQLELEMHNNLFKTGASVFFIIPATEFLAMWPASEDTMKFDQGRLYILSKKIKSTSPTSIQADIDFKIDYTLDSPPFIKGKNKYQASISLVDNFKIQDMSLKTYQPVKGQLEDKTITNFFNQYKATLLNTIAKPIEKIFFCDFLFPSKGIKINFRTNNAFIKDSNIFLSIDIK